MSANPSDTGNDDFLDKLASHPDIYLNSAEGAAPNNENVPKIKRTACILCRRRKLKCDGAKPKCGTCNRLGHECKYDEQRKKSGPKRGYVKALEARLAQVEVLLENNGPTERSPNRTTSATTTFPDAGNYMLNPESTSKNPNINVSSYPTSGPTPGQLASAAGASQASVAGQAPLEGSFSWEMVSLGLEEPLPEPHVMTELFEEYFTRVHPSMPIIHRARFFAALDLAPHLRPPVSLRYAMWTLASGMRDVYATLTDHFYRRARKYLELDEMRGHGENMITLAHCQAWILLAVHEFKNMYFPRAWMSTGRAVRLAQMMGLHRLDGTGLDVKQCLPVPRDWTEREERRRTFWMAFWEDRCASIGTGWPMTIDESDILTNLPSAEECYQNSKPPARSFTLKDCSGENGNGRCDSYQFSSFAGCIFLSSLFGRNLIHLHRPDPDDCDGDLNGKFWERHRNMDGILLSINLNIPDHLRIPNGLPDPNIIFLNMCIHTSVICLHQAAILKAEKNQITDIASQSKIRCITAAVEISGIMRAVAHVDLSSMNPFMAFCLYVAARVFIQYLKARREDQQVSSSLNFLLAAMHAIKKKNPLTESFLAQLEVDMESAGMPVSKSQSVISSLEERGIIAAEHWKTHGPHGTHTTGLKGQAPNFDGVTASAYRDSQTTLPVRDRMSKSPRAAAPFNEPLYEQPSNTSDQSKTYCAIGILPNQQQQQPFPPQQQQQPQQHLHPQQIQPQGQSFGFPEFPQPTALGIPDGGSSDRVRTNSTSEDMDLSPHNSTDFTGGTVSSNHSHGAGSARHSPYTPPDMDTDNANSVQGGEAGQKYWTGTTNMGMPSSRSYAMTNLGPNGIDITNQGQGATSFGNLPSQFFPPTPGIDNTFMEEGWDLQGMTPNMGMAEDWNQIIEGMAGEGWEEQWNVGGSRTG